MAGLVSHHVKSVEDEPRNGVLLCGNHSFGFHQFYFYIRWVPQVRSIIYNVSEVLCSYTRSICQVRQFIFVNHSRHPNLEEWHGCALRMSGDHKYTPLYILFVLQENIVRSTWPNHADRRIPLPFRYVINGSPVSWFGENDDEDFGDGADQSVDASNAPTKGGTDEHLLDSNDASKGGAVDAGAHVENQDSGRPRDTLVSSWSSHILVPDADDDDDDDDAVNSLEGDTVNSLEEDAVNPLSASPLEDNVAGDQEDRDRLFNLDHVLPGNPFFDWLRTLTREERIAFREMCQSQESYRACALEGISWTGTAEENIARYRAAMQI